MIETKRDKQWLVKSFWTPGNRYPKKKYVKIMHLAKKQLSIGQKKMNIIYNV